MPFTPPDAPLSGDPPADYVGLVTVAIRGLTPAATYRRLDLALDALAHAVAALPLSADDRATFAEFLSADGRRLIAQQLVRTGEVRTLAFLGLEAHTVRIRATNPPRPGAVEATYPLPRPRSWDDPAPSPHRTTTGPAGHPPAPGAATCALTHDLGAAM